MSTAPLNCCFSMYFPSEFVLQRRGAPVLRQVSQAESFLPGMEPLRCSTGVMQVSSTTKHQGSSLVLVRMQVPLLTL